MSSPRPKSEPASISQLYAADLLDVVASDTPSSWPPRVSAKPSKRRRKRKLAAVEYPVETRQLPRTIVRVHGADCPSCEQPLLVGRVAVSSGGVLMHPSCEQRSQTSRTTRQIGRSA